MAGPDSVPLAGGAPRADLAYMFGGALGEGAYSDSLWMLCLFASGRYGWVLRNVDDRPSKRARFSLAFDPGQGDGNGPRLYVHGGIGVGGVADPGVYMVDPGFFAPHQMWHQWGEAGYSASGHVSVCEGQETHSRIGKIFTPAGSGGTWTTLSGTGSRLLQRSYPVTFTVSGGSSGGGRVVTASSWDGVPRYADLPGTGSSTSSWQAFGGTGLDFQPVSGVLYRPDKLMIAGGATGTTVVGTTRTLDASNVSNSWQPSASMLPRFYHNLVMLPDGKVLVTGGATTTSNYNANPVFQPQIWDPSGAGGTGTWTASGTLAASTAVRGYHSTSILLPDGRVLCAGGWGEGTPFHEDQLRADIYCPPYLFNANGSLANRPSIKSAPARVAYGERITVCVHTDSVTLGSMALLRPAMTTHAFDQNQRYVPLTFTLAATLAGSERRYTVQVPGDSSIVPPGDYLLFLVNGAGTPSLARWVRVGSTNGDTDQPRAVANLQKLCRHGNWVEIKWTPPAGDSLSNCPSPAALYDVRFTTGNLNTLSDFNSATPEFGEPLPYDPVPGYQQTMVIDSLQPPTYYRVRLRSKDYASNNGNWSAMSNLLAFTALNEECGGAGGGGGCCHEGGMVADRGAGAYGLRPSGGSNGSDPSFLENTLLANVPPGSPTRDLMRLPYGPLWTATGARVRLSRSGMLGTRFTGVRLRGVALGPGQAAFVAGDSIVTGTLSPPRLVRTGDGRDLTTSFASDVFDGHDGDTVYVEFADPTPARISLETSQAQLVIAPDRTGIDLQCQTAQGWQSVAHHDPRALPSNALYDVPCPSRLRLVFRGDHRLHSVARFAPGEPAAMTAYEPTAVSHSRMGDVGAALAGSGAQLVPGENMLADFAVTKEQGAALDWFLDVAGEHTPAAGGSSSAAHGQDPGREPLLRFALWPNQPNPLANTTMIHFDLPKRTNVELTVFDLLGRRVAVLARREFEPGRHQVAWDRRDMRGNLMHAGVYVYRLVAADFRQQRTMVVIP